jgi:hypothetical protein
MRSLFWFQELADMLWRLTGRGDCICLLTALPELLDPLGPLLHLRSQLVHPRGHLPHLLSQRSQLGQHRSIATGSIATGPHVLCYHLTIVHRFRLRCQQASSPEDRIWTPPHNQTPAA